MSQWTQAIGEEASQRIKETPIDTIDVKKCNGQADSHQPSTCCVRENVLDVYMLRSWDRGRTWAIKCT